MEAVTTADNASESNYRIAMSDMTRSYMVYAAQYDNTTRTLYDVNFIKVLPDGSIVRTNASYAQWDNTDERWVFHDSWTYHSLPDGSDTEIVWEDVLTNTYLQLEPDMFRNLSNDISKMPLALAGNYVERMKILNPEQYYEMATGYYERILDCLTPLVLVIIACSMNYRFKKNILFISLVFSVCVAVVYYVVRIMTMMAARQGIIAPYMGPLIPFVVILILSSAAAAVLRK